MTTGSYSSIIDTYNKTTKTWSGADDAKKKAFNTYNMAQDARRHQLFEQWSKVNGVKVYGGQSPVSWTMPALPDSDWTTHANNTWTNLELDAQKELASKILGDYNAGIQMGESPKALRQILALSSGVLKGFTSIKRGDVPGAIRALMQGISGVQRERPEDRKAQSKYGRIRHRLKEALGEERAKQIAHRNTRHTAGPMQSTDVSGAWLGLTYGWTPMIGDIFNLMQELDDQLQSREKVYSVRKSRKSVIPNGRSAGTYVMRNGSWAKRTMKCSVSLKRRPSTLEILGLTDPAPIVWELIPFSFVVDWFVPIGDYLQASSVLPQLVQEYRRVNFLMAESQELSYWTYKTGVDPWLLGGTVYLNGKWKERRVELQRVKPVFTVRLPSAKSAKQAFSVPHLRNAAALIHQLTAKASR